MGSLFLMKLHYIRSHKVGCAGNHNNVVMGIYPAKNTATTSTIDERQTSQVCHWSTAETGHRLDEVASQVGSLAID